MEQQENKVLIYEWICDRMPDMKGVAQGIGAPDPAWWPLPEGWHPGDVKEEIFAWMDALSTAQLEFLFEATGEERY